MRPTPQFLQTADRLEKMNKDFVIDGVPEEYKEVWTPDNKIKLWSVDRGSAEILRSITLIKKPEVILELGTSAGYSGIWLASAAKEYGGHLYTVEVAKPKIEMAAQSFAEAGVEDVVTQIEGKISDVLDSWDQQIDMVFLDADKMNYLFYLKKFEPFLNESAVIIADNALDFAEYMKDYTDYLNSSTKYSNQLIELEHGLLVSIFSKQDLESVPSIPALS